MCLKKYAFSLVLLISALTIQAQSEASLKAFEQQRFDAMVRMDTVMLKKMLDEGLVYIHSNAMVETKAEQLEHFKNGSLSYSKMVSSAPSVRLYGNTGIINGILDAEGILNGAPFKVHLQYTAVYVYKKRQWKLVSWQSTKIP